MTDIVGLLRNLGWPLCHEGADEIERLRAARFEVVQLQPDDDCPGLWIGFKTEADRDEAMSLFEPKP